MRWRVINEADRLLGLTVIGSRRPIAPWLACFSVRAWRLILFLQVQVASFAVVVGSRFVFSFVRPVSRLPFAGLSGVWSRMGEGFAPVHARCRMEWLESSWVSASRPRLQCCSRHALGLATSAKRLGKTASGLILGRWDGVVGMFFCRLSRLTDLLASGAGCFSGGEVAVCAF